MYNYATAIDLHRWICGRYSSQGRQKWQALAYRHVFVSSDLVCSQTEDIRKRILGGYSKADTATLDAPARLVAKGRCEPLVTNVTSSSSSSPSTSFLIYLPAWATSCIRHHTVSPSAARNKEGRAVC